MPDLDRIERKLAPGWRGAYRLLKGDHPVSHVAAKVLKSLAAHLREKGGLPGLPELLETVARQEGQRTWEQLRRVERHYAYSDEIRLATEVARGLSGLGRLPPAPDVFAEAYLRRMVLREFFGKLTEFEAAGDQRRVARVEACLVAVELELQRFAPRLASNPRAVRLRAPSVRRARPDTRSLLAIPLA